MQTVPAPPKVFKRKLAKNHAHMCQAANHPVCKCRCKGKLHGKNHAKYQAAEEAYFDQMRATGVREVSAAELDLIVDRIIAEMANEPTV